MRVSLEPQPAITGTRPRRLLDADRDDAVMLLHRHRRALACGSAGHERGAAFLDLPVHKGAKCSLVQCSIPERRHKSRYRAGKHAKNSFNRAVHQGIIRFMPYSCKSDPARNLKEDMPHHARRRLTRRLMATGALLVASVAVAQIGTPRKEIVQPIPPGASAALPQGSPDWNATQTRLLKTADVGILAQVDEWKRLRGSDALGFGDYARFLMAHPGWPDESRMRGLAERAADPQTSVPEIISFFRQFPPRTASGAARYAIALMSAGMTSEARSAARSAWRMGAMSTDDEALMLGQFAASFTADDHDAHADAALFTPQQLLRRARAWLCLAPDAPGHRGAHRHAAPDA
jgi:hypothetical protein